MKRRTWEFLVLLAVVAVIVAVFRKKPELPTREPVSWNLPVIYSPPGEAQWDSGYHEPMYLKPNLERYSERFCKANIRVDGVGLGMSFEQVIEVLGEPEEIDGSPPTHFSAVFWSSAHDRRTEVNLANGVVVDVLGSANLRRSGVLISTVGESLDLLKEHLGKNDYLHGFGYGGTPLYCWASQDAVLEIPSGTEKKIGGFWLADPTFYTDRPHLWFSGCGGVEDELYIPPNE